MLVELNFDFTIAHIVEFALKRFTQDKGLLIPIKMSYDYYDNDGENDYHVTKWIYIIFHRPDNYTRVFSIVADKPIWEQELNTKIWYLECDHDSCWSTDGFSFVKKLKDQVVNEFKSQNIEYKQISEHVWLEDIKYVNLEKYIYKGYDQREVKLNFNIQS